MFKPIILIVLLTSVNSRRISEEKCQEYKELLKKTQCFGLQMGNNCPMKVVTYECHGIDNAGLIVGGVEAKPGEFPHMAAIGWENDNGYLEFRCGGSLISDRFVLTAAHCGWDRDLEREPVRVRLGVQNLAANGPALVELRINNFIKHPRYDSFEKENDIALIELERPVTFHKKLLRPACLQQQEIAKPNVTATGWGQNSTFAQTTMDTLMKVKLPVVDFDKCEHEHGEEDYSLNAEKQICAGGVQGKDTCRGDSGGPIQIPHNDALCVYDVIGFTSFGNFYCGRGHAVYTKTLHYLDWIEGIVWPQPVGTSTWTAKSGRYRNEDRPVWY